MLLSFQFGVTGMQRGPEESRERKGFKDEGGLLTKALYAVGQEVWIL